MITWTAVLPLGPPYFDDHSVSRVGRHKQVHEMTGSIFNILDGKNAPQQLVCFQKDVHHYSILYRMISCEASN